MKPIIPIIRHEPFDDPAYLFELKLDGFRGVADTVNGRMLSKNGNRMKRFERLLNALPPPGVRLGRGSPLTRGSGWSPGEVPLRPGVSPDRQKRPGE
jgi:hypothetical protein